MPLSRPALVTEEEFLALPESMERIELLDGEVIVSPSPSPWHQELLGRIVGSLRGWAARQERPVFVGLAPLDVRFGSGRILQPGVFVVLAPVSFDDQGPLDRVPEICVEILSTNRSFDRLTKRVVYASSGVQELWLVEPGGLIERRHGRGLNEAEELTETLRTPLLARYELDVAGLFRR